MFSKPTQNIMDAFRGAFDLSQEQIIEIICTDWAARESCEIALFGERRSTMARPFVTDANGDLVTGERLFWELRRDYTDSMLADERMSRLHYEYVKAAREELGLEGAKTSDTYVTALKQAADAGQLTPSELEAQKKELRRRGTNTTWSADVDLPPK